MSKPTSLTELTTDILRKLERMVAASVEEEKLCTSAQHDLLLLTAAELVTAAAQLAARQAPGLQTVERILLSGRIESYLLLPRDDQIDDEE